MNVEKLLDHIQATYFNLRVGIGVMALLLPLLLWIGGKVLFGLPLQSSLSAYYHTDMGNVFVGVLFTIGTFLHLYKGYPIKTPFLSENRALDAAGICALGVALFPTDCPDGATCTGFTWGAVHGTFAVLVFSSSPTFASSGRGTRSTRPAASTRIRFANSSGCTGCSAR